MFVKKMGFSHPYKHCLKSWLNFQVMLWYTWFFFKHLAVSEYKAWLDALKNNNYKETEK